MAHPEASAHVQTTKTTTTSTDSVVQMPPMPQVPIDQLPRGLEPNLLEFLDKRMSQHVQNAVAYAKAEAQREFQLSLEEADRLTYRRRMWRQGIIGTVAFAGGVGTTLLVQRISRNRAAARAAMGNR